MAVALEQSVAELRRRHAGAFRPRPWIYRLDLLASAALGWGAFAAALWLPWPSLPACAAAAISVLAMLRAVLFIHEIAHRNTVSVRGFETVWHLLVGLPLLAPSLMYWTHRHHHRNATYGTDDDPEWAPLESYGRLRLASFVLMVAFVPALLALRWGVLAPLGWLIPPLRRFLVRYGSTLVINPAYRRPLPEGDEARRFLRQELAACATVWLGVGAVLTGAVSWPAVALWYGLGVGVLGVNQLRTLAAHRYVAPETGFDSGAQLLDSVNLETRSPLTVLAAPVGLRFHALHHLLPGVPYHALGALHRQLLAELPEDAPYRSTRAPGILAVIRDGWFAPSAQDATTQQA